VKPGQQVVKIVHDALVEMLGDGEARALRIAAPPAVIMMAGLQGSGKTTTTGKLACACRPSARRCCWPRSTRAVRPPWNSWRSWRSRHRRRCAADRAGTAAADIARRAMQAAKLGGYDVLILDTAGRTTLDEQMMSEAAEIAADRQSVERCWSPTA
jgi:signal recognition particle subunit SRP54